MNKLDKKQYLGIQEMANIMGCSWNVVRNHIVPHVAILVSALKTVNSL